jgi:GTP-binding protein
LSDRSPDAPAQEPLVVRRLEFLGGSASAGGWRPQTTLPEVAVAGRSNVGKSSVINRLVNRKKLARVSNTPGRTREINFFRVNDDFVLVDLPGYGYAKISKEARAAWKPLIEGYLRNSPTLRGIVQLLDARHDPTRDDLQMLEFLAELRLPTIVVATKVDKVPRGQVADRIRAIGAMAGVDEDQMIAFSAVTGAGRGELAEAILALVKRGEG